MVQKQGGQAGGFRGPGGASRGAQVRNAWSGGRFRLRTDSVDVRVGLRAAFPASLRANRLMQAKI